MSHLQSIDAAAIPACMPIAWAIEFVSSAPGGRLRKDDMTIKNGARKRSDDLRPEYNLTEVKGGVRGKYFARASAGTTLVVLEPDVAKTFPTAQAVNEALRALAKVAQSHARGRGKLPPRPLQPTSRKRPTVKRERSGKAARG
jgi:hypothetical protein